MDILEALPRCTMKGAIPQRQQGFTLLELLIALAITGLVVALMFAGFGAMGRAEERNQHLMDRTENMLAVGQ